MDEHLDVGQTGGTVVALVLVFAALSSAQVWILPQLTAALQAFWHAHLGGDLSLSPADLDSFVARTLLLLPLAPALTLLSERIDPRTRVQLQRVLTPADLVEPTTTSPPGTPEAAPSTRTKAQVGPASKAKATRPPRKRKREPTQQITIDSFLAQEPTQAAPPSASRQTAEQQPVPPSPTPEAPPQPPNAKAINWDDVAS